VLEILAVWRPFGAHDDQMEHDFPCTADRPDITSARRETSRRSPQQDTPFTGTDLVNSEV
jgi:hypothetical protein